MVIRRISKVTAGEIEKALGKKVTVVQNKTTRESILQGTANLKINGGTDKDLVLLQKKGIIVEELWSWEFMWRHTPGHVRAHTWLLIIVTDLIAFGMTNQIVTSLAGAILVGVGEFLSSQATHLEQENHKGVRMSWIESKIQHHPLKFRFSGFGIFALGLWVAFHH